MKSHCIFASGSRDSFDVGKRAHEILKYPNMPFRSAPQLIESKPDQFIELDAFRNDSQLAF